MKLRSLRRHTTYMFLLLFILVQAAVFSAIYYTSTNTVQEQIQDALDGTTAVFERILEDRTAQMTQQAKLLAKDFGFREAIATEDKSTIASALSNIQTRVGTDLALLMDLYGNTIQSVSSQSEHSLELKAPTEIEMGSSSIVRFVHVNNKLYEIILVPVKAPILVGWVALGQELGNEQSSEIQFYSSLDVDVAFIFKDNGWKISGSSSSTDIVQSFIGLDDVVTNQIDYDRTFKGESYAVRYAKLPGTAQNQDIYLLLHASLEKAMSAYSSIFLTLLVSGVGGIIFLFIGSFILSHRLSRPISQLAKATIDLAKGNYEPVELDVHYREVDLLAVGFSDMANAVKEREDEIMYQACHDPESHLPNRSWLENNINEFIEKKSEFAIITVEIQQFESLRIVLDHNHINKLVAQIAERLFSLTGSQVARISTDTYGLIINPAEMADTLLLGIKESFKRPFQAADLKIDISLLMGLVVAPKDGKNSETLISNTHSAIDQARNSTKGYAHYNADQRSSHEEHLSLMSELRDDIVADHVYFAFQPKLNVKTGKIVAAEALMRWESPKLGFVSPETFIPMAERTGDITHLTAWALSKIIKQAALWHKADMGIMMSANLSGKDLQNEDLPELIGTLMTQYKLPASALCLEVTESAVMDDMECALNILEALDNMGIKLSIDDYGTGYSSLAYLKRLPVQELKIDKTFVLNLATSEADSILVQSTIDLAHNLGLTVTAEGVEDAEALKILDGYGCDIAQGYFISRPIKAKEFEVFMKEFQGVK